MSENNLSRGFCRDYHTNGEPKTYEDLNKEINFAIWVGTLTVMAGIIGLIFWATWGM